jgi:putative ABC transport system permease protein
MRWLFALRLRLRSLFRGRAVEEEMLEEYAFYIDRLIDEHIAAGMSPDQARAAALRRFGRLAQRMDESRDARRITFVTDAGRDLRYAVRVLRRSPGFTAVALLSLALGTGANTAVFQLMEALRLRPLPVSHPGQLAIVRVPGRIGASGQFSGPYSDLTYPQWEKLRERQQAFSNLLAWNRTTFDLSARGESRFTEDGLWVSGGFFDLLGVRPALGRLFTDADDEKGCAAPGVVLSHRFWSHEYHNDPSAVGRTISINGRRAPIVGVVAPGFHGVEVGRSFDLALPLCAEQLFNGDDAKLVRTWSWWLGVMGRLEPGWTLESATAHLQSLSPALYRDTLPKGSSPGTTKSYLGFRLAAESGAGGFSALRTQYDLPLRLLLALAGIVLLIACANLANLLLARMTARQREVAVRLALGASRARVFRQLLVESLVLAAVGTTLGAWIAPIMCRAAVAVMQTQVDPVFIDVAIDWRVLGFVVALAAGTCVLFGTAPALGATRVALEEAMKSGGRSSSAPRGRLVMRRALVVAQVALSLVLLVGGLLFARTLVNLLTTETGFRQSGILELDVDLRRLALDPPSRIAMRQQIFDRVRAVPGVERTASAMTVPLVNDWSQMVHVEEPAREKQGISNFSGVSPRYFATLDIPIVRGRDFDEHDRPGSSRVAIVNERFVERFFGTIDPIGRPFFLESDGGIADQRIEIVGVVGNTKYGSLREPFPPIVYLGAAQNASPADFDQILMRSSQPLSSTSAAVRAAIEAIDPRIAFHFHDFEQEIRYSIRQEHLMALLCGFFAALAAILATIGVYGVMAYAAAQRTSEIGIRLALGADRRAIVRMMLGDAVAVLAGGLAIGLAVCPLVMKTADALLFGLQANDRGTLALAVAALSVALAVSSYLPARRAAQVDPVTALRAE